MDGVRGSARTLNDLVDESQQTNKWKDHLDEWLDSFKVHNPSETRNQNNTLKTYTSWLTPWVDYLLQSGGVPSSLLIKKYLETKYGGNPRSFNRVGKQIVHFTNQHINGEVYLKKKLTMNQPDKMHARMCERDVKRMKEHVRAKLVAYDRGKDTVIEQNELAKYLAIFFLMITGCRPNEAACVVFDKTVKKYTGYTHVTWDKISYIATVTADLTKTKRDYRWHLKNDDNIFYNVLQKVDISYYKDAYRLYAGLDYWFEKVRADAGVDSTNGKGGFHNMRSVRCYHATEWVKFREDMIFMKWIKAIPPNPLQHATVAFTIKTYAEKGANDSKAAQERCLKKYREKAKKIMREDGFKKTRNQAGDKRATKLQQLKRQ